MAVIDATGTDYALVATTATTTTKAECDTAFAAGKRLIQVKTVGSIGGTRAITEHKFFADDTIKSVGGVSYGNMSMDMPFNAADAAGQAEARTIFGNQERRKLLIKTVDGNYTVLTVICSGVTKSYAIDDLVMLSVTFDQDGAELEITA